MQLNWYLIFAVALVESFVLAIILTELVRRLAIRWNILDNPGHRKMHSSPVPLLGGIAIFATFNGVILINLGLLLQAQNFGLEWMETHVLDYLGDDARRKLLGIFAGGAIIFILGVVDDIKALSPEIKLVGQIAAALVLVLSGVRLDFFIAAGLDGLPIFESLSDSARANLTVGISGLGTMLWVVMMTNSLNFLDNMDGLCAGVSCIAALSFFLCLLPTEQYFVCVMLMVFAGSMAGFLFHNFSPAKIFMGDAGSMFSGYILATVAVLGTFFSGSDASRVAVAAPLLALCVPLFDTFSVIYIRWRSGESIMKGDKRHFSHRLVELGMEPRKAVDFIFLVAAVTGLGGAMLSRVDRLGTVIILAQTAGVFLLIVLLMNAGRNSGENDRD
jgi:UDP-GlcNAc:undecaprenyl-phosphate GlcNAc-1-phosphate transferase